MERQDTHGAQGAHDGQGEPVRLASGASTLVRLRAGSRVRAIAGSVVLAEPPVTLDGTGVQATVRLRAGQAHPIGHPGWTLLTSERGAHLVVMAPPPSARGGGLPAAAARLLPRARRCLGRVLDALAPARPAQGQDRSSSSISSRA